MQESYGEGIATHTGPESCGAAREGGVEALTGVRAGRVLSREREILWDADDERTWEVGQAHCTDEVPEQGWATGGGGDGGKWPSRREPATAKRAPDTEPGRRAQCAGEGTTSSKKGQEGAVYRAPAPRLQRRNASGGLLQSQEGSRAGRGWRDVAALRGGAGREPPGPFRKAETRSIPGKASPQGVHPEGRRAAEAARCDRAGGQARPARDGRGAERHLRDGLSRLLVRVPAGAEPA